MVYAVGMMQPPVEYLKECFSCDPAAGKLFWRARPRAHFGSDLEFRTANAKYAGAEAHSVNSTGYRRVKLSFNGLKKEFLVHRIIWAMAKGAWPESFLDHRNTVRLDNRLDNLRLATNAENMRNMNAYRKNRLGLKGVCKVRGKFKAEIRDANGKRIYLGVFDTPEAASAAYNQAAIHHHGEFARA